ncbi:hypothetical protein [Acetobacterium wieringae]|uniref:Uncharacterized protein n=1 Tax=Acetobacterium wieringae TaxID=52694 RepID=A0A1F2PGL0_9FIRM|nr:hypothetical protein [Acetobacterium wieringae]OFV70012.1 hypothetical protein ACWI_26540 [Acetobacterium wieringae]
MRLIINKKNTEFKNAVSEVKPLLAAIIQVLAEDNLELSHLLVDGVVVYQDYEDYLSGQIETIAEVEAITLELKPLIEETLNSAFDYIGNALGLLKPLAEAYYQSPGPDAWKRLAELFEGLGWLLNTMNRIDQIDQLHVFILNYDIWNEYVQTLVDLNDKIKELEQAMLNQDHVLIGDLILYEILPIFEAAEEKLRFLVPTGGAHVS